MQNWSPDVESTNNLKHLPTFVDAQGRFFLQHELSFMFAALHVRRPFGGSTANMK
jgi:hypothetical protein